MAVPSTKWLELNAQQYYFHVNIHSATLYKTHGRTSEPERAPAMPRREHGGRFLKAITQTWKQLPRARESISLPVSHFLV